MSTLGQVLYFFCDQVVVSATVDNVAMRRSSNHVSWGGAYRWQLSGMTTGSVSISVFPQVAFVWCLVESRLQECTHVMHVRHGQRRVYLKYVSSVFCNTTYSGIQVTQSTSCMQEG